MTLEKKKKRVSDWSLRYQKPGFLPLIGDRKMIPILLCNRRMLRSGNDVSGHIGASRKSRLAELECQCNLPDNPDSVLPTGVSLISCFS